MVGYIVCLGWQRFEFLLLLGNFQSINTSRTYSTCMRMILTHLCLASHKWDIGSVGPDQMLQNAASDQGLHCLY